MSRKRLVPLKSFARDSFIKKSLILAGTLFLFQLAYIFIMYSQIPPVIPLFYSLVKGEQQLANKPFLFVLPVSNLIFILAHLYLSKINYQLDRLFARLVSASTIIVTLLTTIATFHIIIITT